jgi:hypothetical protein
MSISEWLSHNRPTSSERRVVDGISAGNGCLRMSTHALANEVVSNVSREHVHSECRLHLLRVDLSENTHQPLYLFHDRHQALRLLTH